MTRPSPLPRLIARLAAVATALALALPAAAEDQDPAAAFEFSGDRFVSGSSPDIGAEPARSVFAAGETVRSPAPASGSVHLAGRRVEQSAPVAGSVYAAGQTVRLSGETGGDASLAGQEVHATAPVSGALRAAARRIEVDAPVGALLAFGRTVRLNAEVAGDAYILAERLELGPEARILGTLSLGVEEAPDLDGVALGPVERIAVENFDDGPGVVALVLGLIWSVVVGALLILAAQAAFFGLAPRWSDELAFDVMERPFRSLGLGFLALAALVGAIPIAAATLIGLPLAAFALALTPLALLAGYALGAWALGASLWRAVDRPAPEGFGARLLIGLAGLAAAALLALIPFFGWMVSVALTLVGVGAGAARLFGPRTA
ncbi:MAG: hypothetical protein AAGI51_01430 [Pseudomonadota bacterium]